MKQKYKTPGGLILGLNQIFAKQLKENPNLTYSIKELSILFSEKVNELNKFEKEDKSLDLIKKSENGERCEYCEQYIKLYKRKITSSMAYALILIYRRNKVNNNKYIHLWNYFKTLSIPSQIMTGDVQKLRYWGLIESLKGKRKDGSSRVGYYKITEKGRYFIEGKLTVPKYVLIYNSTFYGFSGNEISIKEAIKDKFNYNELMES